MPVQFPPIERGSDGGQVQAVILEWLRSPGENTVGNLQEIISRLNGMTPIINRSLTRLAQEEGGWGPHDKQQYYDRMKQQRRWEDRLKIYQQRINGIDPARSFADFPEVVNGVLNPLVYGIYRDAGELPGITILYERNNQGERCDQITFDVNCTGRDPFVTPIDTAPSDLGTPWRIVSFAAADKDAIDRNWSTWKKEALPKPSNLADILIGAAAIGVGLLVVKKLTD